MTEFTPISALVGGALIGLAAALLLLANGRIAGVSGIVANAIWPLPGEVMLFVLSMLAGMAAFRGLAVFEGTRATADPGLPERGNG